MIFPSRHIAVTINRPAKDVYAYAANPENLPAWATGLGPVKEIDGKWVSEMDIGSVTIAFAEKNSFGILDHDVTLPSGESFYNPMRVFPNGDGCEVTFTLYRQLGTTDEAFEQDGDTITKDLWKLKKILER